MEIEETDELYEFNGNQFGILIDDNDQPWFFAAEVCNILGYSDASGAVRNHCKRQTTRPFRRSGSNYQTNKLIIPMSDLMRLVVKSRLPAAVEFEERVFEDILPSIARTGSYNAEPAGMTLDVDPRSLYIIEGLSREYEHQLTLAEEENVRLSKGVHIALDKLDEFQQQAEVDRPYVEYTKEMLASTTKLKATDLSKEPSVGVGSGIAMNKLLIAMGIVYRASDGRIKPVAKVFRAHKDWFTYDRRKWTVTDAVTGETRVRTGRDLRYTEKFLYALPGLIAKYNLKIAKGATTGDLFEGEIDG